MTSLARAWVIMNSGSQAANSIFLVIDTDGADPLDETNLGPGTPTDDVGTNVSGASASACLLNMTADDV